MGYNPLLIWKWNGLGTYIERLAYKTEINTLECQLGAFMMVTTGLKPASKL